MADPIEDIIVQALERAGIRYATENEEENPSTLDFYLPDFNVYIEVKQFHSGRIAIQMAGVNNVIAIQGRQAAEWFASCLEHKKAPCLAAEGQVYREETPR